MAYFAPLVTRHFIGGILLVLAALPLHAQEKASPTPSITDKRIETMKLMASKMETIHDMLDGALLFKNEPFAHAIKELKEKSGSHLSALFPKGSFGGKSRAKETIWSDWKTFEDYAMKLNKAVEGIEKTSAIAIKNGNIVLVQKELSRGSYSDVDEAQKQKSVDDMKAMQQSFMPIAQACKSCHEKFKKPKDKSQPK